LNFTIDASVASLARLALKAAACANRWGFANVSEEAAWGALDNALSHAATSYGYYCSYAPMVHNGGILDIRFNSASSGIARLSAPSIALLVAWLANLVGVDNSVRRARFYTTPVYCSVTLAFRYADATDNNTWTLRIADTVELVA
jgi:hypothetical protein